MAAISTDSGMSCSFSKLAHQRSFSVQVSLVTALFCAFWSFHFTGVINHTISLPCPLNKKKKGMDTQNKSKWNGWAVSVSGCERGLAFPHKNAALRCLATPCFPVPPKINRSCDCQDASNLGGTEEERSQLVSDRCLKSIAGHCCSRGSRAGSETEGLPG